MSRVLLVLPFAMGCACLPAPSVDPTPPTAGLTIEYRPVGGGARVTRRVLVGEADVTLEASKDAVIAVLYTGGDDAGVRKVELEWEAAIVTSMSISTTLGAPLFVESGCPKPMLLGQHNFDPGGREWRYRLTTRSDNWLGASVRTPRVTVLAR